MLKRLLVLLLGAILITSIAAFPTINAQLLQHQQMQSNRGYTPTLFQNIDDGFRVQVPQGWVIQDINNTGSVLLGEATQGYGILAQLCLEEEGQQQALPSVAGGGGLYGNCEGAQQNIIYILRYPMLDTKLQSAFGVNINNGITTDNVLLYHIQKLEQVGYRSMQIVNSTETAVNLTDPQTNQTIQTVPAKFVEMAYSTASAPNEARGGYFILTATNATRPNVGMTKGYSVFYEGSSAATTAGAAVQTTTAPVSLSPIPLSASARQVFDSFELIAAPEIIAQTVAQSGQTRQVEEAGQVGQTECDPSYPDVCIASPPPNLNCQNINARNFRVLPPDPHGLDGNDNDGIGCETGSNASGDTGGQVPGEKGGDTDCDPSYPDDCIPSPPPDLDCNDEGVPENFQVLSPDPHDFDRDSDGIGCETGSNAPDNNDDEDNGADDDDDADNGEEDDGDNDNGGGGEPAPEPEPEPEPEPGDGGEGGGDGGDGGEGDGGNNPNEFEDCEVVGGGDAGDVGC